jgi:mRNA interferase MazF
MPFSPWDVVKVPFPYTDRPVRQNRPALVIAAEDLEHLYGLLWVSMITSAENRGWSSDVEIGNLVTAGLPAASVIRTMKIACIEARDATKLGVLTDAKNRTAVIDGIAGRFAGLFANSAEDAST